VSAWKTVVPFPSGLERAECDLVTYERLRLDLELHGVAFYEVEDGRARYVNPECVMLREGQYVIDAEGGAA